METESKAAIPGILAWAFLFVAVIGGSGCPGPSNEKLNVNAQTFSTPPDQVAKVGITNCTVCHGLTKVPEWLIGEHGNEFSINPALNGTLNAEGIPSYADLAGDTTCLRCHDQLGDGHRLEATLTGNVPRPVIGCESCHGGGAVHFGAGKIPFPKPGPDQCGKCHNHTLPAFHLFNEPDTGNIAEDFATSAHSRSISPPTLLPGGTDVKALCSRCHTSDGYHLFLSATPETTGHDTMVATLQAEPPLPLAGTTNVQCRACHFPTHKVNDAQPLILPGSTDVNLKPQSTEFNTCTSCHQLVNDNATVLAGATAILAGATIINGDSFSFHDTHVNKTLGIKPIVTDNHAAVPGDVRGNFGPGGKFLYYVKKGDRNACAACHNRHSASAVINKQYALSGHGNVLADPWIHYDWKLPARQACERCHTTTGFVNYAGALQNLTVYNPAANNFSYLIASQNESLYCWGCHTDTRGTLRKPGRYYLLPASDVGLAAFPAGDPRANYLPISQFVIPLSGDTLYPDLGASNVCVACHSGRESGGSIKYADQIYPGHAAQADFSAINFKNAHYLAAAGTVYRELGYEFPSYPHDGIPGDTINPNYANLPQYKHKDIGTAAAGATVNAIMGTNGPCVGCHMHGNPQKHLFNPIIQDGATIVVQNTGCVTCHQGADARTPALIEHQKALFNAGIEALRVAAVRNGLYWKTCNPYLFNADCTCDGSVAPLCGNAPATQVTNWCEGAPAPCLVVGKNNMGAAFNLNEIAHEPGSFAHNQYYTRHLIYDSIDWFDDHVMNQSVAAQLPTLVSGATLVDAQVLLLGPTGKRP